MVYMLNGANGVGDTSDREPSGGVGEIPPHYRLISIGSGSSGNAYYLSYADTAILIDAGIAPRTIRQALLQYRIDLSHLSAILVTHDHADHVRGVGYIATTYDIPIYASQQVSRALLESRYISDDIAPHLRPYAEGESLTIGGLSIRSFAVPHDSADNRGYSISSPAGILSVITDIGHLTPSIREAVARSNYLILEANYDREMLLYGKYPPFLKERILSPLGHISNEEAAECLASSYHLGLKFVALCHLSKDNNHPDLAWKTVQQRLMSEGIRVGKDLQLHALKRNTPSPIFYLYQGEDAK